MRISILLFLLFVGLSAVFSQTSSLRPAADWAQSLSSKSGSAIVGINGVAIDSAGNIYVCGTIGGRGSYNFGPKASVTNPNSQGMESMLLVKFNPQRQIVWTLYPTTAPADSRFNTIAIDASGNVYVGGKIDGKAPFVFANGIRLAGSSGSAWILCLVKVSPEGKPLWAKSTATGTDSSLISDMAINSRGEVIVAGQIGAQSDHGLGNDIFVKGTAFNSNVLVAKYSPAGDPVWGRTLVSGFGDCALSGVAVDGSDNVYVSGFAVGPSDKFGGTAAVHIEKGASPGATNGLLLKYDNDGLVLWSANTWSPDSKSEVQFSDLAVTSAGNIFVVGNVKSASAVALGNGVVANGVSSGKMSPLVAEFSPDGTAIGAAAFASASSAAGGFSGRVVALADGNVVVSMSLFEADAYDFGQGFTVALPKANVANLKSDGRFKYFAALSVFDPSCACLGAWAPESTSGDFMISSLAPLGTTAIVVVGSAQKGDAGLGEGLQLKVNGSGAQQSRDAWWAGFSLK